MKANVLRLSGGLVIAALVAMLLGGLPVASTSTAPVRAVDAQPVDVAGSVVEAATIGPTLTVASYNVCKTDCAAPAPPWDVRRERVARTINESTADIVGLQEATNQPTAFAKTQAQDIAALVATGGYAVPAYPNEANECRRPRDANGQLAGPSPCDNTAMLLYRAGTVQQVTLPSGQPSAGILLASSIAPGLEPNSANRSVAWAYLQALAGGGPVLAVSAHTDNAKTPESEAARVAFAQALGPWADAWNGAHGLPGIPVIVMADLNSYAKRQPNGAQWVLASSGWVDAATAPSRRNVQYSTINYNPLLPFDVQGFPARPYAFKVGPDREATRIDYVMARGAGVRPLDYEVVIHLTPDGAFDPAYQGSDHQMVRAVLSLGG